MNKLNKAFRELSLITFLSFLIGFYFFYLIVLYILPNNFRTPFIIILGFSIIILSFYYFFVKFKSFDKNKIVFSFRMPNENLIKLITIILMFFTFFIPSISFTETIIDWSLIGFPNYIKSVVFLFGIAYLPGACIFKIFFPKSNLHKKFGVEPFLVKITIYPLISFTLIGSITLFLEFIGLTRIYYASILQIIIILLFIIDIFIQRQQNYGQLHLNIIKLKISNFTFFVLFITLGIIIIAFGLHLSLKYCIPGDMYRAISYANYIGRIDTSIIDKFYTSGIYWGHITFSLSILTGLPYVNINALMFPFVYLFVTSIYLLLRAILYELGEKFAILSTIFIISFSSLFYFTNPNLGPENISLFIFDGILFFRHKSFAIYLWVMSAAIFIINIKNPLETDLNSPKTTISSIILSVWFLIQSYMIYFLPIIPAISLILIYSFFSKNKKHAFRYLSLFMKWFVCFFIFFDIITNQFFSWVPTSYLAMFLNLPSFSIKNSLLLNSVIVYSFLIGFFLICFLTYKVYLKSYSKRFKKYHKIKHSVSSLIGICIFTVFLEIAIIFNFILKIEQNFFLFYLDIFFLNIGFVGIMGIYLFYFSLKENSSIFYLLLIWILFLFGLASFIIFIQWWNFPNIAPFDIPYENFISMNYWFNRIWYYLIIPLSIFAAIGLIKLKELFHQIHFKRIIKLKITLIPNLLLTFILIFFIFSNTIIAGLYYYNIDWKIKDDEAYAIGWISKNLPWGSNILIDRGSLYQPLKDIAFSNTSFINDEIYEALQNYTDVYDFSYRNIFVADDDNNIIFFNNSGSHFWSDLIITNLEQDFGYLEFYIRTSNGSRNFWMYGSNGGHVIFDFTIRLEAFYFYNGSNYQKIRDLENNKWYLYKLYFDCTPNNNLGLNQYFWRVNINGTDYGNFTFNYNASEINSLSFYTDDSNIEYQVFINNFNFSWAPNYNITEQVFKKLNLVSEHLESNLFKYYLYSRYSTYYRKNAEFYFEVEKILLPYFYNNKIFEYGDLILYSTNRII